METKTENSHYWFESSLELKKINNLEVNKIRPFSECLAFCFFSTWKNQGNSLVLIVQFSNEDKLVVFLEKLYVLP